MLKCFYKATKKEKLLYASKLSVRSSAYGQEIVGEFNDWKQYVDRKNTLVDCKFRLLTNGDIGNNCVIGPGDVRYVYSRRMSEEGLPELWLNGAVFALDANGYIIYDANRVLYPGETVRAWGIICLPQETGVGYYLVAIASEKDKCNLTVYLIDIAGKIKLKPMAAVELPSTYATSSFVSCIGSNIFVIHDEKLGYYRFVPDKRRIETVMIGNGEFNIENGEFVREPLIVSDGGDILWVSENRVCKLRLGNPGSVCRFGFKVGFDITTIQSFNNVLYVYYKSHTGSEKVCYTYPVSEIKSQSDGELFNENAHFNLILEDNERQLRYVKITDARAEIIRRYKDRMREVTERSFVLEMTSNKVSLFNGELYVGSLRAGFIKNKTR